MTTTESLIVWQCTHCSLVRSKPCARVCRLDTDHPDTVCWDQANDRA